MNWREYFGLPLNEERFFKWEIDVINNTKSRILIKGYDEKFFENENCISALQKAKERKVKISAIIHMNSPISKLENLTREMCGINFHRSYNPSTLDTGFRLYDRCDATFYDKGKKSSYLPEKNIAFYRKYESGVSNGILISGYKFHLKNYLVGPN